MILKLKDGGCFEVELFSMFKNEPGPHVVLSVCWSLLNWLVATGFIMEFDGKYRVVFAKGLQNSFCVFG